MSKRRPKRKRFASRLAWLWMGVVVLGGVFIIFAGVTRTMSHSSNSISELLNASKAYMSIYMDGMRFNIAKKKLPITVSDIRPGFVDTELSRGGVFWVATPKQAAKSIYKAILKKKKVAYITPRWRLIAGLLHLLPDRLYHRI